MTQLGLFSPLYAEEIDRTKQTDRFPPVDAPCLCGKDEACRYPFCKPPEEED